MCHDSHINVHETGAIEHGGHKVLAVNAKDGLLEAEQIGKAMELHYAEDGPEHTVQPGMVYISFSSELGAVYTLQQLRKSAPHAENTDFRCSSTEPGWDTVWHPKDAMLHCRTLLSSLMSSISAAPSKVRWRSGGHSQ